MLQLSVATYVKLNEGITAGLNTASVENQNVRACMRTSAAVAVQAVLVVFIRNNEMNENH